MKGTEKQITWATDLIETMECRFREVLAECKRVQPSEYDQTNLVLGTIKAMFDEAYAGDVIALLKDNHRESAMEYYNILCCSINSSTLSFAKELKEEIANQRFTSKLVVDVETVDAVDDEVEIINLQNIKYAEECDIDLVVGNRYHFVKKGKMVVQNSSYQLYIDGLLVTGMAVPVASGHDGCGVRYSIFRLAAINELVAFRK